MQRTIKFKISSRETLFRKIEKNRNSQLLKRGKSIGYRNSQSLIRGKIIKEKYINN